MKPLKSIVFALAVTVAVMTATAARSQYNPLDAITRVQRAVERRMVREIGGSNPSVTFERRTDNVQAWGSATQITGTGYYRRDPGDPGTSFQYRGTVDRNSGRVSDAQYTLGAAAGDDSQRTAQAIQAVQSAARDSVQQQQQRGDVTFNQDVQAQRVGRTETTVRGTGTVNRRGRARTFTYSGVYNNRSRSVSQLQVSPLGRDDNPNNNPNYPPGGSTPTGTRLAAFRAPSGAFLFVQRASGLVYSGGNGPSDGFQVIDRNGGSLSNGDPVAIYTGSGYLTAERGGGGNLLATGRQIGAWETFTIVKIDPSGGQSIRSGDRVAFRSANGQYWTAENGGGSKINCKGTSIGPWEGFLLDLR